MRILFKNIKELLQVRTQETRFLSGKEMKHLPSIKNAFLSINGDKIVNFGSMSEINKKPIADKVIDVNGKIILPTWCDSHTHIVYAGNRENEFVDKIKGLSYQKIAQKGGGILNSSQVIAKTSEETLYQESKKRLEEVIKLGTGAIEIKSGYGLSKDSEIKMLRVIQKLKSNYKIKIKSTFLGAHAVPYNYKNRKEDYLKLITEEMIPKVASEKLAEYIDIFCEKGYFSVKDTETVLESGKKFGLIPKIHSNQFSSIGGIQVALKYQALSVDHLEEMTQQDIDSLKNTKTMPVALPACSFFLGIPYTPARKMIDSGLPLALSSDYNPGSSPCGNMNFIVSTACIKMKMTPEESINAATINSAYAMGLEKEVGSITVGKQANFIVTKPISSYNFIPYSFGNNQIEEVYINGEKIAKS